MRSDDEILELSARYRNEGRPFAIATVVRSRDTTSAKAGAKAMITADGVMVGWIGGGCALNATRSAASRAMSDGRARLIRVRPTEGEAGGEGFEEVESHCPSRGTLDIFVEPMLPAPVLVIMGTSPVGQALAVLAKRIGFAVTAAVREGEAPLYEEADAVVEGLDVATQNGDSERYVVVATQGRGDREALAAALEAGATYVAFVASRRKAAKLKEDLAAAGHDRARVDAIRAPAGLDIGAVTPEEIAVSILAEIVAVHREATGPGSAEAGDAP
ncbi:MAG: XdhC family protein [Alphaproteobacteria bacterium]